MKILFLILLSFNLYAQEIYNFSLNDTAGKKLDLGTFKGKPFMLVNIATKCGYTGQLDNLENLYKEYKEKGFVVVGLPSNDFGGQTPEGNEEVAKFCRLKYGASFPISEKIQVLGEGKHPLIAELLKQAKIKDISWNFEKFIFDKKGKFVTHYKSATVPDSQEVKQQITTLLK